MPVRHFLLLLLLAWLAGAGAAWGQRTTTAQPSRPAMPDAAELKKPQPGASQVPDSVALRLHLRKAATLQATYKDSEALAEYQAALKLNPQQYNSLWRAAVLSVSIGNRYSDETRKSAYFEAAHQYAERALALYSDGGEASYAMSLALFSEAGLLSARDRLRLFKQLRPYVFATTAHRPDMPEGWQLLGRWHYRVAHYNVLERLYSRVLLGGYPQGASTQNAMDAIEQARHLDSTRIQYCYDLARIYKYRGSRRRAINVLQQAIRLPTYTSEDLVVNRLCQQMLPPLLRAAARRDRIHARWYERLHARPKR